MGSKMTKWAMIAAAGLATAATANAASAEDCAAANGAEFICGVSNVEDFARLPGGHIIGSDLAQTGAQGYFYLFNPDRTVRAIKPEEITVSKSDAYAECPGAPDWTVFGPHGIDFAKVGDKSHLLAVNHGGREAVEVFDVDLTGAEPKLTWTGCVMAPQGAWPDDIAILPDGGFIATSLWDPADEARVEKLSSGKEVGGLFEWHPGKGWAVVPGSEVLSGPNGVVATPDGNTVYVAAWSGNQIATLDRQTGKIQTIATDFPPDNLVWSEDGKTILVGGIYQTVPDALACFGSTELNCPETGLVVARLDPATGVIAKIAEGNGFGKFGAATGAIDVGKEIWVNSFRSDRVAVLPLEE